jgi:signal transduction histidine kinase
VRHDLANVLTGISFYGSQLAADLPPETASAMDAAAIGEAVERGGGLLNLLLELWRDAPEPEVVPLDPAAVVDAIARVLAVVAEPRALEVGPLESMVVRASRRLLEEALLALVVEARAATRGPGGPLILAVTVEQLAADNALGLPAGVYAAVSVGDAAPAPPDGVTEMAGGPRSGSGGSSQDGEPEVVSTLDANLASTRFGKPGRGIAIARHAARTAGGWLRIERWPGGGTRATILLPQAISRRRGAPEAGDARTDA